MNVFLKKAAYLAAITALSVLSDILLARLQVVSVDEELKELVGNG